MVYAKNVARTFEYSVDLYLDLYFNAIKFN